MKNIIARVDHCLNIVSKCNLSFYACYTIDSGLQDLDKFHASVRGQGYIWTALDKKTLHVEKQLTLIDELDVHDNSTDDAVNKLEYVVNNIEQKN
ncbi:hypothetical protein T01_9775 [Trichinella spiralis]|uniref:Uncharacterized protein n=1 Tax=Trichinella spiralis TaxID=6334 RepID=A0A0V1B1E4_TRISP|nr:hypothetical protein T01_9775 [Trichinella spiralis]